DPREQNRSKDPSPFGIAQPSNRRERRNGAILLDDSTRSLDSGSGGTTLPLVLECGQRDLSNGADFPHAVPAHARRAMGGADPEGAAAAPPRCFHRQTAAAVRPGAILSCPA